MIIFRCKRFTTVWVVMLLLFLPMSAQQMTIHLSDGTQLVGYISMQQPGKAIEFLVATTNERRTLEWKDIVSLHKEKRSDMDTDGLDDELVLRGGRTIRGQIVEQIPGKDINIYDRYKGTYEWVRSVDVRVSRKVAANRNVSIWKQTPYINIITMKSGIRQEGLIVEQHSGATPSDRYLLLLTRSGYREKIMISEVDRYEIIPNKN